MEFQHNTVYSTAQQLLNSYPNSNSTVTPTATRQLPQQLLNSYPNSYSTVTPTATQQIPQQLLNS